MINAFHCTQEQLDGAVCFVLDGELELSTVAMFRAEVRVAVGGEGGILLDLQNLRYFDSSGIDILLDIHRVLSQQHRRMAFVHPTPAVRRILSVLNLEQKIPTFFTPEEALAYLRPDYPETDPVCMTAF
jgi:anti-anti-sigma factor